MFWLETEHFGLNGLNPEIVDSYFGWLKDPELDRYGSTGCLVPKSREDVEQWYRMAVTSGSNHFFEIRKKSDHRLLGMCGIMDINQTSRTGEISIIIGSSHDRRKGIAGEVFPVVIEFGFRQLNLRKLKGRTFALNPGGEALMRLHHFQKEGALREEFFRDGEYQTINLWALFKNS